ASLFRFLSTVPQMGGWGEPCADILVGKAAQAVITVHHSLEQLGVRASERIEARTATACRILFPSRHPVQIVFRFRWIVDDCQRFHLNYAHVNESARVERK